VGASACDVSHRQTLAPCYSINVPVEADVSESDAERTLHSFLHGDTLHRSDMSVHNNGNSEIFGFNFEFLL
jgi:hypothetical protein